MLNYLKDNKYDLDFGGSFGLELEAFDNEILIIGSKVDLIELADYIVDVALSDSQQDHLHLDKLTLINTNSKIENIIIEKE